MSLKSNSVLWNEFSPNKSVFDLWEFRKPWIEGFGYKPHFVHIDDGSKKGLLPLWYDKEEKKYMFVGSDWPEDNTFFVSSPGVTCDLIAAAPRPLQLTGLLPFDSMEEMGRLGTFEEDSDLKYVLPIKEGTTFESLLSSFPKKYRYNLRYDHRRIIEQNAQVTWTDTNDPSYFDRYVAMKYHVFKEGGKDENYYADKRRAETFRQIISSARSFKVRVMEIKINGQLAGIDIVFIYNNTYYLIGGAYDTEQFSGVGNAALYLLFKDAIDQNAELIDCLQEDDGWKHRYFEGRPLYIFTAS